MAKSTKVNELAGSLSIGKQELVEMINNGGLGFTVKSPSSSLTDEQEKAVRTMIERKRQAQCASAIDEKSQSTARTNGVRVRRKPVEEPKPEKKQDDFPSGPVGLDKMAAKSATPRVSAVTSTKSTETKAVKKATETKPAVPKEEPKVEAPAPKAEKVEKVEARQEVVSKQPETAEPAVTASTETKETPKPAEKAAAAPEPAPAAETEQPAAEAKAEEPKPAAPAVESKAQNDEKSLPKSKEDKKKNRSGKNKSDKSLEHIFELQPRFEKDDFSATYASVSAEEDLSSRNIPDEDEDDLELKRNIKKKNKPRKNIIEEDIDSEDADDFDIHSNNEVKKIKKPAQPSNIKGFIDPEEIKRRLAKDNKTFGAETGSKEKNAGKNAPARKVVNQKDLYSSGSNPAVPAHAGNRKAGKQAKGGHAAAQEKPVHTVAAEHKRVIRIAEAISISDLARDMGIKAAEVIRFLMTNMGTMMTVNQTLDIETAEIVASEFGYTVQDISFKEESFTESKADNPEDLVLRAPVVTVMGHVDHGKTSLLDAIRNSRVTAQEAGGITQHIGASTIDTSNGKVVFLDTPGHEAFTTLRARGAQVTDLVVLVVAADDGVMPQTVEAINHAKAANVPIIVAINKIDKSGANPERVKQALTEYGLIPEDWGGTTIFKEVSALTGEGIDELLELIYLQSEILELKANPNKEARGVVLEAYKDTRRGTVASLIVQEGTLHANDIIVTGATFGKIKSMVNDKGKNIRVAPPSTPVEITGLSEVPEAGEPFFVTKDEKVAKEFTEEIKMRKRNDELKSKKFDPWAAFKENKQLNVILKTDVQGTLEALEKSLSGLSTNDVELCIVHAAVGGATESDVQLAIASNALIIGFNTRPEARAMEIAKREGIIIETFSIIYDVIDKVKEAMSGLLDPVFKDNVLGHAEVRNTFNVPKIGTVAGCYVTDGIVKRNAHVKLLRNGKIIYDSKIASLKRFKDDAKEVRSGYECGLSIENYNDVKVGDIVEAYEIQELKQSL